MQESKISSINKTLIAEVSPYFIDKEIFWFEKNYQKILEATKTQSFFADNILFIEKNQYVKLSEFLRKLDELGYEKVEKVEGLGEFAVRGGIVDVFPINSDSALRFEFLGNYIENIEKLAQVVEDEKEAKERLKKKLKSQKLFSELKNLKPGDYLVHLDHGVGRFLGIEKKLSFSIERRSWLNRELEAKNSMAEGLNYYVLKYAQEDKLYIPVGLERKLSRYVGFVGPKISRLGSPLWQRTKRKVKEGAEKLAKELLRIYAQREIAKRPAYLPESEIDFEIKGSFPFEETPDQMQAIEEIKQDLEKEKPMDRLVCGDSGFGKTEVALRAMIKAVSANYQVAMICPTTILASQHFQNFSQRFKKLPVKIALVSRLLPKKEQQKVIEGLKTGRIEIAVGTHRLLSKDVCFKNLGLLVIDEEQRFGVRQKEKLKKLRACLDVLSLSATPIPRTLYLALSNLRDISFVQTPPEGRRPVKTFIFPWSEALIKKAIDFEIKRKGQVYYLHNRVETIAVVKDLLEGIGGSDPAQSAKWKIGVVHGRMREKELVKVMADFQQKKINVLVATTIIETGLDFPDVNTLIVADATRLGLSQAYQIRGRVGRSPVPAFAYFLYPPKFSGEKFRRASPSKLSEKVYPPKFCETKFGRAQMRLTALKEAEALGSGFRIARRDLEIRGAGNILGREQSGNVNAVGLNLYCQMIAEAVEKLKV